jgi:hypothetical protein
MTFPCGKYSQTWNTAFPAFGGKIVPGAHSYAAQPTRLEPRQTTWV